MNLTPADVNLFYKLMWAVQFHVNRQLNILKDVDSVEAYAALRMEQKVKVRDALYKKIELIDRFVTENPAGLSADELEIVKNWKRYIAGEFYIWRFLKRHTIFVSAKNEDVYAVVGLSDSLADVMQDQPLPILVEAVLLPFKDRIIYDGLLRPYAVAFGGGYRASINEVYQRAKQHDVIIESLKDKAMALAKQTKVIRDWRSEVNSIVEAVDKLKRADQVIQARAFSLLKASTLLAQAVTDNPDDLDKLDQLERRVQKALTQFEVALEREG